MKNASIQGLRAIAAMIVFMSHALLIPELHLETIKQSPFHFFFDGQISVMIFISLSGFLYYNKPINSYVDYLKTIKNKIKRIYIPYILIMILSYFLLKICIQIPYNHDYFTEWGNSFWNTNISFIELIKQCTILWPHNSDLLNPPSWYLAIEVRLFLIIPLLLFIKNKSKAIGLLIMLLFIFAMFWGFMKYVGACLLGYFSHMAIDYYSIHKPSVLSIKNLVALFIIAVFCLNINNEIIIPNSISYVIQAIGAAILLSVVYKSNVILLTNRFVNWIGDLSYEFYLTHFVVLLSLRPIYKGCGGGISFILLSFIISIIISYYINVVSTLIIKRM